MALSFANLTLVLEIAMGVGLLIGALLARLRRFRQHAWCQSGIVLVNLAVIAVTMIPSFRVQVIPKIPLKLGTVYYGLATAHAALGTITEVAGLYILLAAGTSVLPEKLRITKYKLWMRIVLLLWWVVLLLGLATTPAGTSRICSGGSIVGRVESFRLSASPGAPVAPLWN